MDLTTAQLDQFAEIMRKNKPHLIAIEEKATQLDYGSMTIKVEVRGGVVSKMSFIQTEETWLSPKNNK